MREREFLNKKLVMSEADARETFDLVKIQENTKKNLVNEINVCKTNARRQQRIIETLELDREKYDKECSETNQNYYAALEDVKMHEAQIAELQKKIVEGETRQKQKQNLYEACLPADLLTC